MQCFLTQANGNLHDAFLFSRRTDAVTLEARGTAADFLGAAWLKEFVFDPNMRPLMFRINQALASTLKPVDKILVSRLDYGASTAPWLALRP
jgi:selenocysteine lyase/cysteine desulfurase